MNADVTVKPTDKGKFKVMVNYVQRGIEYSSQELAEQEADKIRKTTKALRR